MLLFPGHFSQKQALLKLTVLLWAAMWTQMQAQTKVNMKQVLLPGKWGMEVDDVGMMQAETENWRQRWVKEKGKGWQEEAGGSGLESWQESRQAGRWVVVQEY